MTAATRSVIVRLLENIGGRKEVNDYLRHYRSVDSQRFAVITFGPDVVVSEARDEVAAALSFLHEVGLMPIVLVEGRDDAAEHPREQTRRGTQREVLALADALEALGCRARPIVGGVFVERVNDDGVDDTPLLAAIKSDQLPIIGLHASSADGSARKANLLNALGRLARHLQPHKVIWLDQRGGLLTTRGDAVDAVNLAEDYTSLRPRLETPQRALLDSFRELLDPLPPFASLSVTSPAHLARELFTHRGAGTLIRKGERVQTYQRFADLDVPRLRQLVESCFERPLVPEYFETKRCHRVYLTDSYRATAIVTTEGAAPPYLDKYAVTRKAQGEGIGGSVWTRMRDDHPKLFWRSRTSNSVNGWYFEQADGAYRTPKWTVFWCGIEGFEEIERCVHMALSLPPTLVEPAADA